MARRLDPSSWGEKKKKKMTPSQTHAEPSPKFELMAKQHHLNLEHFLDATLPQTKKALPAPAI